jgi:hypothetical protein
MTSAVGTRIRAVLFPLRSAGLVTLTAGVCKPVVLTSRQIDRDAG